MTNTELADVLKEARSLLGLAEPPGPHLRNERSYPVAAWEDRRDDLVPRIDSAIGYVVDGGPIRGNRSSVTDPREEESQEWDDTMRRVLSRLSAAERVVEAARTLRVELDGAATVVEQRLWNALDAYDGKSEPVTDPRD